MRFIVNGSIEFSNDKYVINHKGLSYHWSPFWKECDVCSSITMPHFIIHLDTMKQDLSLLIKHIQGDTTTNELLSIVNTFPHTHSAEDDDNDGHPVQVNKDKLRKYFSTLTRRDIEELYEKYKLDHMLFGYSMQDFLQYIQI